MFKKALYVSVKLLDGSVYSRHLLSREDFNEFNRDTNGRAVNLLERYEVIVYDPLLSEEEVV